MTYFVEGAGYDYEVEYIEITDLDRAEMISFYKDAITHHSPPLLLTTQTDKTSPPHREN